MFDFRGRENESKREKHRCEKHQSLVSRMCPDQGTKQQLFGVWGGGHPAREPIYFLTCLFKCFAHFYLVVCVLNY